MPRACNTCAHKEAGGIAKVIAEGGSNSVIARRFGVTESSVQRHRVKCLRAPRRTKETGAPSTPAGPAASVRFEMAADPQALIRRAELLLDDAMAILARAKADSDSRLGLQAVRECRSSLELLMKAHGMLAPDAAVNVNIDARRQSIELTGKLSTEFLRRVAARDPEALAVLTGGNGKRDALSGPKTIDAVVVTESSQ